MADILEILPEGELAKLDQLYTKLTNVENKIADINAKDLFIRLDVRGVESLQTLIDLTQKECDVVKLLSAGLTHKQIADSLGVNYRTILFRLRQARKRNTILTNYELVVKVERYGMEIIKTESK